MWALTRIETATAREAVRFALNDRDQSVRQAALHSAAVWRDTAALPQLLDALKSEHAARPACGGRGARTPGRPQSRRRSARAGRVSAGPNARTLGDIRPHRNRRSIVDKRWTAGDILASEARRAHRARSDGGGRIEGGGGHPAARLIRSGPEGDGLVDRRPPPGVGQRAGRVFPGTPDRHESH